MPQNAKQLKQRIRSVDSTMHITKAMELVASSKLRRATENMEASRPYFASLGEAIAQLSAAESVFTKKSENARPCYIVIAGDRGLAAAGSELIIFTVTFDNVSATFNHLTQFPRCL